MISSPLESSSSQLESSSDSSIKTFFGLQHSCSKHEQNSEQPSSALLQPQRADLHNGSFSQVHFKSFKSFSGAMLTPARVLVGIIDFDAWSTVQP